MTKKRRSAALKFVEDFGGLRFAFFGGFAGWPGLFGDRTPAAHVERRGARVVKRIQNADYVVLGEKSGPGKKDALRALDRRKNDKPTVLDEAAFLHLARPSLKGLTFLFAGGFSKGLDVEGPSAMVTAEGGIVAGPDATRTDYLVVGPGRGAGKAELVRRFSKEPDTVVLSEEKLLGLFALVRRPTDTKYDVRSLALHLRSLTDPGKVDRGVQMLKRASFQLHVETSPHSAGGIVKSQSVADEYYAAWIHEDGRFACFDRGMTPCMGQAGDICKHLVVLLLGLSAGGQIEPRRAYEWAKAASPKSPLTKSTPNAELLLRYGGFKTGEIAWRPTETVPEGYYAL